MTALLWIGMAVCWFLVLCGCLNAVAHYVSWLVQQRRKADLWRAK